MSSYTGKNSFLYGANEIYIAEIYERYLRSPNSVDPEWAELFRDLQDGPSEIGDELRGASWAPRGSRVIGVNGRQPALSDATAGVQEQPRETEQTSYGGATAEQVRRATLDSIRALMFIRAYRVRGHLHATLDPLGLEERMPHAELDPATYGFTEEDYDRPIFINYVLGLETRDLAGNRLDPDRNLLRQYRR